MMPQPINEGNRCCSSAGIERVMIVGGPGSGKSTLAVQLGEVVGLPVFHMDRIHYLPGWQERSKTQKSILTQEIHARKRWILEGGHSATYAQRAARANILIWLDVPIVKRLYRVLRRAFIYRGKCRPDMQEGCPERLDWQTVEFLLFMIRTRRKARNKLLDLCRSPPDNLSMVRLTNNREIDHFLSALK